MSKTVQLGVDLIISSKNTRDVMLELERGLSKTTKGWMREVKRDVADTIRTAVDSAVTDGRSVKAWNNFVSKPIIEIGQQIKKAQLEGNMKLAQQLHHQLREQKVAYETELRAREAATDEILKKRRRSSEEMIDEMKTGLQDVGSSLFDGKSLADQLVNQIRSKGGLFQNLGRFQQGKAQELAQKGGPKAAEDAAQMAKMGKQLAQLGKGLVVIGAIGASLIMLVKLFMDLESRVKDMNKALIASAGAADFGLSAADIRAGGLHKQLELIRDETTAVNENFLKFRVTAEEQNRVLNSLNQAGLTYGKMNEQIQEGRDFMKSYSDVTAIAATYARNLGSSTEEIAQQMGTLAFETGDHLQDIAEQFSLITRESMAAGFSTKRFYSTVLEATSGMAFYGVRIEEAARMLKSFDSLLGEAVGSELYKTIVGKGKDMSAQDRIREIILKNPEFVAEQYGKALNRSIQDLTRKFGQPGGPLAGMDIAELLKLDEVNLQRELQKAQMTPEQINQFLNARLLQRAASGDLAAMTQARGFAGPGFDIALAGQATGVFGNRRIDEVFRDIEAGKMGAEGFAALEQATGKSQDELIKLSRLFTAADAQLANLSEIREKLARGETLTEEDMRVQKMAQEKLGLYIDQQTGQILRGQVDSNKQIIEGTGVAVENAMDVVTAQAMTPGDKEISEQLTKDQEIATEISKNITGLNEIMQQSVSAILNDIYDVLLDFYKTWLGDAGLESQKIGSIEKAHAMRLEQETKLRELDNERSRIRAELDEAKAAGDTKRAQELQKQLSDVEKQAAQRTKAQIALAGIETELQERGAEGKGLEIGLTRARETGAVDTVSTRAAQQTINMLLGSEGPNKLSGLGMAIEDKKRGGGTVFEDLMRERFEKLDEASQKAFLETFGGQEGFDRAIDAAIKAAEQTREKATTGKKLFRARKLLAEEGGAAKAAFESALLRESIESQMGRSMTDVERAEMALSGGSGFATGSAMELLRGIEKNTEDTKKELDNPFAGIIQAQDLILPAGGGRPIMTDPADTLMAFKPGGPISQGMGRAGNVQISFNLLGSPKENVTEILRVLKATGVTE